MRFGSILICLLLWPLPARADQAWLYESEARFVVSTWPSPYADTTGHWTLVVNAENGRLRSETNTTVWFQVTGNGAMDPDSTYHLSMDRTTHAHWTVAVRRTGKGPIQIRSLCRFDGPNSKSYDLCEYLTDVEFRPGPRGVDSVVVRENRIVRQILVRDGKRYRCGGQRFVAIDADEQESPREYRRRATALSQSDLHCADCKLTTPVEVPVVVTVGRKGTVTWARPDAPMRSSEPVPQTTIDPHLWMAIERGLGKFRYQAAEADGHPVADYAVFKVRVVP